MKAKVDLFKEDSEANPEFKYAILTKDEQIIAAPTLIKKLPLPFRRIIGDMSNIEKVLLGLDLKKVAEIKDFQKFQHT